MYKTFSVPTDTTKIDLQFSMYGGTDLILSSLIIEHLMVPRHS